MPTPPSNATGTNAPAKLSLLWRSETGISCVTELQICLLTRSEKNQQKRRKWDKESLIFYETFLKNHSAAVCFVMSAMVATVQVKQYPPSLTWPQIFTSPSCLLVAKMSRHWLDLVYTEEMIAVPRQLPQLRSTLWSARLGGPAQGFTQMGNVCSQRLNSKRTKPR